MKDISLASNYIYTYILSFYYKTSSLTHLQTTRQDLTNYLSTLLFIVVM